MESTEDEQLERVNSLPDLELASTSSSLSSILTAEDSRSTTSSGEVSRTTTSSSGEIPALLVPVLVDRTLLTGDELRVAVARSKCVGRNNKGVTWGFTSVIGRRREMEDAVAVIPGFMSRTCDHVGGCTAPGSRTSSEISPVHFFGVYDGHGGNQYCSSMNIYFGAIIVSEESRHASGTEWSTLLEFMGSFVFSIDTWL